MQPVLSQVEVITRYPPVTQSGTTTIADDAKDSFKHSQAGDTSTLKPTMTKRIYESLITFVFDDSMSTIPIFMRYFAFHECVVLLCGAAYYLQADLGAVCISIVPGLSIISMFAHFLRTQFPTHKDEAQRFNAFWTMKHYAAALFVFVCGAMSIFAIYHTNTYLSTLIPSKVATSNSSNNVEVHQWIRHILEFPHRHSIAASGIDTPNYNDAADEFSIFDVHSSSPRPFNYRLSFVGSIIAPLIEETSKFLLLSLTFPMSFLWRFSSRAASNAQYCRDSLFLMFIALCGGCGIAIMENIGYLAACQWPSTRAYCLPNKNIDILGAGLARGIFSVPFHCVTACILADALCAWMHCAVLRSRRVRWLKFIMAYPIAMALPVLLHSSFNFWMKGLPFVTGVVTIVGFGLLAIRIAQKHAVITQQYNKKEMKKGLAMWYGPCTAPIDVEICEPEVPL